MYYDKTSMQRKNLLKLYSLRCNQYLRFQYVVPRQTRRWGNLAKELARRAALVKAGNVKPFGPGPLQGVENLKIEF